jgi:hypothetical protein
MWWLLDFEIGVSIAPTTQVLDCLKCYEIYVKCDKDLLVPN